MLRSARRTGGGAPGWWGALVAWANGSPARLVALLGLICVLPLSVLTPPFQVPDEAQHFFRAYQVSELDVWSEAQGGKAGEVLPRTLPTLAVQFLGTADLHAERPVRPTPLAATLDQLDDPLEASRREFVNFTGAAFYSPLPYIPQAAGIAIGRAADLSPLALLFIARAMNAIAAIALLSCAAALVPRRADLIVLIGLLPMAAYEYASAAPDGVTIATAILFTALVMRSLEEGRWTIGRIVAATLAGCVFCSLKPVYAPLLLAGLVPACLRRDSAGNAVSAYATIVIVSLGTTIAWLAASSTIMLAQTPGVSPSEQLALIAQRPDLYLLKIVKTIDERGVFYYTGLVGLFGWLTVSLPKFVYAMPVLGFLVILWRGGSVEGQDGDRWGPWWNLLMAAGCFVLTLTALYLMWTPVGGPIVEGVQGRYLLPFAALAATSLLALGRKLVWPGRSHPDSLPLIALITVVNAAAAYWSLISAYQLLS